MKRILAILLVCLMVIPAFAGCAAVESAEQADEDIISSDGALNLNAEESIREVVVTPVEKAFVRGGNDWKNLNWREILSKRGMNQNNAEPLVIKVDGNNQAYTRYVYFTFDISEFDTIPYRNVYFKPMFTDLVKSWLKYSVYSVDPNSWKTDTLTWATQPQRGKLLAEGCMASAFTNIDLTDAVDEALKAGRDKISLVIVPVGQGDSGESHIDWRGTTLTATTATSAPTYVKTLVDDPAQNKAIWDWAQQLYDEWYARYQLLLERGKPQIDLIPVDENEYTQKVLTTGAGSTSFVGIETKKWTEADFKVWEPTRTMDSLIGYGDYSDITKEQEFDEYGGLMDNSLRQEAKGFFYTTKIGDRWWVIDPLGYPCYIRAVSGVGMTYLSSPNHRNAALKKYGTDEKWGIAATRQLKDDWCFNASAGGTGLITNVEDKLIIQKSTGFVGAYGTLIGTNNSNGGNTSFSGNNTMNVFDPAFVDFVDEKAKEVENGKDDKYLLGRTVDNELPIEKTMLYNYLRLSASDPVYHYSYATAWTWLVNFTGKADPTEADVTEETLQLFAGFVYDRFYYLASTALRKYDPNHMVLGSRMLIGFMDQPWVLRFAGLHLDCLTLNWYREWDIPVEDLQFVSENANIPFMITEFYTKGMDSGLENTRGAGWVVKTQKERGLFYQCYTLRLLECKNLVGWHWFQYLDNDPDPNVIYKKVDGQLVWRDQSSIDANKGIVSNSHEPYDDLVNSMAEINKNVYKLIEHFDAKYAK